MVHAKYISHPLHFKRPAGTSRGILLQKPCWYIKLTNQEDVSGIGEVSLIPGLSVEDPLEMEIRLDHLCKLINLGEMDPGQKLPDLPGIQFALETALQDLRGGGNRILYPSGFTDGEAGIPINGLIWMGDRASMTRQISRKIDQGFRVLKMKVGALDPEVELGVLARIRSRFGPGELEIRLDANGAWSPQDAPVRMCRLAKFGIHSIEQPIAPGQVEEMAALCEDPVIPVALDEELIGIHDPESRKVLMSSIRPSFVVLKPGLLGGFSVAAHWIELAAKVDAGWWITSALESSIGLNAIAQWAFQLHIVMPQGLGTGMLYSNNIPSPLQLEVDMLWHRPERSWKLPSTLKD